MKPKLVYLNIIFIITLAILLVLSAIFIQKMADLSKADEKVDHTYRVLRQADLIENNLTEAESGARGFLLTRDSGFFNLYRDAEAGLTPLIDTLRKITSDNVAQQKNVTELRAWVTVRLNYLTKSLHTENDTVLKTQLLLGKYAMDSSLAAFAVVKSEELHLLSDRNKSKVFYLNGAPKTFRLIFIFTMVIFIISFLFIAQELRKRASYRKALERRLLELDQMHNNLQEFSFIASHNLQEPLRKIRVFSDMLLAKHRVQLGDEVKQIIKRVELAAGTMHELINDFVNFINLQETKEEVTLINPAEIIERASKAAEIDTPLPSFDLHVAPMQGIYGHADQLALLFKCLLDNSIKFKQKDVPLKINISGELVNWKDLPPTDKNLLKCPYYKISFADNGIGFDNLFSKKIFRLFQHLDSEEQPVSAKGTGLTIVEHIMLNHHGYVTANGILGAGAIFDLFFPMEK